MAYCVRCGAYIPEGQSICLACGYDPEAAQIALREKAEKELKEVKDQLAAANQTITDQKGQIEQLTTAAAAVPAGSPANNGQGAEEHKAEGGMPAYDHTKSPLENARIRKEYMAKINA